MNQPVQTLRFDYRQSGLRLLVMVALVVGLCAFFIDLAMTNDKGWRIFRIPFSPTAATWIFWGLAATCSALALIVLAFAIGSFRSEGYVELGMSAAKLPKPSLSGKLESVDYSEIQRFEKLRTGRYEILVIHGFSNEWRLAASYFASPKHFSRFVRLLQERASPGHAPVSAYALERIVTPEQRAEFEKLGLNSPFTSGPAEPYEWLVDRPRGLYFVNLGGGNDRPYFLVLADRSGVLLHAEGERHASGRHVPGGMNEAWNIRGISIPRSHADRVPEILALFREALDAYGSLGDANVTRTVTAKFGPTRLI